MYLKQFDRPQICQFNIQEGSVDAFEVFEVQNRERNRKTSGFCKKSAHGWSAVYPGKNGLVLQIDNRIWNILDDDVVILYFHNYEKKTTTFRVENRDADFEIIYDSWWKDREDFNPDIMAASCEPENMEEDFFGYVDWLSQPEMASRLFRLWSE